MISVLYERRPETTHEIVMISGKVVLEGTEKLRIICPHGVRGVIEATEYLPENMYRGNIERFVDGRKNEARSTRVPHESENRKQI